MSWRVLCFSCVTLGILFWIGSSPKVLTTFFASVKQGVDQTLYQRELRITGLHTVSESQIRELLPVKSSSIWWRLYPHSIANLVRQHSHIESVELRPCSWYSINCFDISLHERQTTLLAKIEGVLWMVGADGGFLRPLESSADHHGLPIVEGALIEGASPEITRARLRYAQRVLPFLEEELGQRTEGLELRKNGELVVKFVGLNPEFVFAAEEGTSRKRLEKEVRRLRQLLKQLGDSIDRVERVDLAFKRVAVVKLRAEVEDVFAPTNNTLLEKDLP